MDIEFKVQKKDWRITSDSQNYKLTPGVIHKETNELRWADARATYFSNLGGLLSSLYQMGLRDSDSVTTFRELTEHSKHIQNTIDDIHGKLLYDLPFKPKRSK